MDGNQKERSENIVAQFNIVDIPTKQEQYLQDYNHCPLCGTELLFTHVTNFIEGMVKEDAHCMTCNIRTKSAEHELQ
jgi:transcription elongation factor Elf1